MIERILLSSLFVACSWVVKGQDLSGSWVYKETRKGVSYYSKEARMEVHRSGFEFGFKMVKLPSEEMRVVVELLLLGIKIIEVPGG